MTNKFRTTFTLSPLCIKELKELRNLRHNVPEILTYRTFKHTIDKLVQVTKPKDLIVRKSICIDKSLAFTLKSVVNRNIVLCDYIHTVHIIAMQKEKDKEIHVSVLESELDRLLEYANNAHLDTVHYRLLQLKTDLVNIIM